MSSTHEKQLKLLESYCVNSELFSGIENLVRPNIFTSFATKKAYEIIYAYHQKNVTLDGTILVQKLIAGGVEKKDTYDFATFFQYATLPVEIVKEYVEELFYNYAAEYLKSALSEANIKLKVSTPQDVTEGITMVKNAITDVELAISGVAKEKSIQTQFKDTVQRIKDLKTGKIKQAGFSWGIPSVDKKTIGIMQGINVVAADKGGGKSSLAINIIVKNAVIEQLPLLCFSLEMTAVELLTNVIANIRKINSYALRIGSVDENDLLSIEEIGNRLNDNFVIDETGGITWNYFEVRVRAFRKKHKIPYSQTILVILDYLGLMKNAPEESRMSKEEKVEQICTELMRICKNENIALVKLAQFSRETSKRGNDTYNVKTDTDKLRALRPRMSDLKGSSAIESNAVTILLLYRPEYYGIMESDGKDFRGLCEINIAKGRYVNPEPIYVKFQGKYNNFEDLTEENSGIITEGKDEF